MYGAQCEKQVNDEGEKETTRICEAGETQVQVHKKKSRP